MLILKRKYFEDRTEGSIFLPDGIEISTLERPWKANQQNISCIPEGEYIVVRDHSGKFTYFAVTNVEGRTNIEMHPANRVEELNGCIAPCLYLKDGVGYHSTAACMKLIELFGNNSFHLKITS